MLMYLEKDTTEDRNDEMDAARNVTITITRGNRANTNVNTVSNKNNDYVEDDGVVSKDKRAKKQA